MYGVLRAKGAVTSMTGLRSVSYTYLHTEYRGMLALVSFTVSFSLSVSGEVSAWLTMIMLGKTGSSFFSLPLGRMYVSVCKLFFPFPPPRS